MVEKEKYIACRMLASKYTWCTISYSPSFRSGGFWMDVFTKLTKGSLFYMLKLNGENLLSCKVIAFDSPPFLYICRIFWLIERSKNFFIEKKKEFLI